MGRIKNIFTTFLLLIAISQPAAAGSRNSYTKSVHQGETGFDISSRPAVGCSAQIVTVVARRSGKKIAGTKADVDYLAKSARIVDLAGDGSPVLAVFSRTTGGIVTETLDVYWLDGTVLRRVTLPELDEKSGYKGGDRFHLEDRMVVRTVPVYRESDPIEKPTGGTRTLTYGFREAAFTLYVQAENAADSSDNSIVKSTAQPVVFTAAAPMITGITAVESGIEIKVGGMVKYKTMKLEKPERIAIDIPGADSNLAGKKVAINRFGISTVRVGSNKGFLRIVLDSNLETFPKHEVKPSSTGILVEFAQ